MPPKKIFWEAYSFQLRLWFYFLFFYFLCLYVCGHDNFWKAQPIQTKFSHVTFEWNSSAKFADGHRRSHVTPPPPSNRGFYPPLPPFKINIPLI